MGHTAVLESLDLMRAKYNAATIFLFAFPGKDSCGGDSGGPLVYRKFLKSEDPWYQVGIVSYGSRKCGIGIPGVYTKISAFLPWIAKNMMP